MFTRQLTLKALVCPLIFLAFTLGLTVSGQAQYLAWAKRAGGSDSDYGYGITVLADGSSLVTGYFNGTATFGPGETGETLLTSAGASDIFVARYNADGTLDWARRAGGSGVDHGHDIAVLSDGSALVTGWFFGTATFGPGESGETLLTSAGASDIFVARYNPDGTLFWARRAGGSNYDYGRSIAVLSDGSALVTGYFWGTATFGPGEPEETLLTSAGDWDIFVARYNPDGTLAWAKRAGGSDWDYGNDIAVLSDGSALVTGTFAGTATFGPGEPGETTLTSAGGYDIFVARYNADGTLAWAKRAGGTDYEGGHGIAVLSDGTALVTGYFEGTATFGPGEPEETLLTSAGGSDIFVARYNPNGTLAWAKGAGGSDSDIGYGIAVLADGSSLVTGWFWGTATFGPGEPEETLLTSAGGYDIFVAKFISFPDIDSEPGALDFGQVLVWSSIDLDYELWNRGGADLIVTGLEIKGADASAFSLVTSPSLPLTILPNESQALTVRFQPTSPGAKTAYVETWSNDLDENPFTSPTLSGLGMVVPDIDSEPVALDFGQVLIGATKDLDYELWNRGAASLEVTSIDIMGEDADQFSFVNPPSLPLTLAPETCQTIDVRFQPTRICYKDAYVETRSNDPDEDPFTSPTLQAKGRYDRLELCGIDINDTRLLSIAGDYEFLFSGTPELTLSGSFTQDARGRLTFTGTIREDDTASSISTSGKLKIKKKTGEVYAKLKPVKVPASGAKVKLALVVKDDDLALTIKYKKKGAPSVESTAFEQLVCRERGARIVIEAMNEIKPGKKYEGSGTLILPCELEVPVTIKEKAKQKKDGSIKLKYSIKGKVDKKLVCNLGLLVSMSSPTAETMELQKAKAKISYVKKIDPATVELVY